MDLIGLIIAIVIIIFFTYILFEFFLPFFLTWLLPMFIFYLVTFFLIKKGRKHPSHFDIYMESFYFRMIILLAFFIPLVHAGILFVFEKPNVLTILVVNFCVILLSVVYIVEEQKKQKKRYYSEGHHLEDMKEDSDGKRDSLKIKYEEVSAIVRNLEALARKMNISEFFKNKVSLIEKTIKILKEEKQIIKKLIDSYEKKTNDIEIAIESLKLDSKLQQVSFIKGENLKEELKKLDEEYEKLMSRLETEIEFDFAELQKV